MLLLLDARGENHSSLALIDRHLCASVAGRWQHAWDDRRRCAAGADHPTGQRTTCALGSMHFEWLSSDSEGASAVEPLVSFHRSALLSLPEAVRLGQRRFRSSNMATVVVNQLLDGRKMHRALVECCRKADPRVEAHPAAAATGSVPSAAASPVVQPSSAKWQTDVRAQPTSHSYVCSTARDGCGFLLPPVYSVLTDIHEYTLAPESPAQLGGARALRPPTFQPLSEAQRYHLLWWSAEGDASPVLLIDARQCNREAIVWLRGATAAGSPLATKPVAVAAYWLPASADGEPMSEADARTAVLRHKTFGSWFEPSITIIRGQLCLRAIESSARQSDGGLSDALAHLHQPPCLVEHTDEWPGEE